MADLSASEMRHIDALRQSAAALEASPDTVTVELSLPVAWLLRDMIGIGQLAARARVYGPATEVPMVGDLSRLNRVLGPRIEREPHVSGWANLAAARVMGVEPLRGLSGGDAS